MPSRDQYLPINMIMFFLGASMCICIVIMMVGVNAEDEGKGELDSPKCPNDSSECGRLCEAYFGKKLASNKPAAEGEQGGDDGKEHKTKITGECQGTGTACDCTVIS